MRVNGRQNGEYTLMLSLKIVVSSLVLIGLASYASASFITDADIVSTSAGMVASGNGMLDLILFGSAGGGGVTGNDDGGFDGDDANTDMASGGGSSMSESYITSIGELRDFYALNFPDGQGGSTVDEIALFVDLNETGQVNDITLNILNIVINSDAFGGGDTRDDPLNNDISSAVQNGTGSSYSGGTLIASLDATPKTLSLNVQGAGFADYVILTGVNPFDEGYAESARILFFWDSTGHDNGGETYFLSGSVIPEPATLGLLLMGGLAILKRQPVRRSPKGDDGSQ